ncbi:channel protein TolC [Rhizobium sp. SEMIA4064]|nr:TolC family outer membrane protein [Rhizobium paranaense]PST61659.1 channel protein TolC [Rhizobium sp. SEMIA4064]
MVCRKRLIGAIGISVAISSLLSGAAYATTLQQAIDKTMKTNPQIMEAAQNREATEFQLRQARGLYLPSVDLESGYGRRRLSDVTSGALSRSTDYLNPADVSLTITQTLYDGGDRKAQKDKQAARVDSASFRVQQRSEALALEVTQDYLEYMLQTEIVAAAEKNVAFHKQMVGNIEDSIKGGALTDADRYQGRERLQAANARLQEAKQELDATKIRYLQVVGEPISNAQRPASVAHYLPKTLDDAVFIAQKNNPQISSGKADVNAADADVRGSKSAFLPKLDLVGSARMGDDVDGNKGNTNDVQVGVVAKWNLYHGGIDTAHQQELVRRAAEQRYALSETYREVDQSVRSAWSERTNQAQLAHILDGQEKTNAQLVTSYREQFKVGQRSLLDLLDAQNTRFNTEVLAKTADVASLFAEYKILAASGSLLSTMKLKPVDQATPYARDQFAVSSNTADPGYTKYDSHQKPGLPMDLLEPIR